VLTDGRGRTLYTSDADPAGKSKCDARCSTTWKAVRAPWTAKPDTAIGWDIIVSEDGTRQWAFKGKAVYTYDRDIRPGDTYGHGIEGRKAVVLQPLPPNPSWVTYQPSDAGVLVADENGATLYMLDETRRGGAKSGIQRPQEWKPVIAKPDAVPVGNWGIVENNGLRQWTHKGMLVYTHVLDKRPGQLHGVRSTDAMWRTIMRSGEVMEGAGP
jgi:predicted lipoprotein with Yx(FWY)xxD motif